MLFVRSAFAQDLAGASGRDAAVKRLTIQACEAAARLTDAELKLAVLDEIYLTLLEANQDQAVLRQHGVAVLDSIDIAKHEDLLSEYLRLVDTLDADGQFDKLRKLFAERFAKGELDWLFLEIAQPADMPRVLARQRTFDRVQLADSAAARCARLGEWQMFDQIVNDPAFAEEEKDQVRVNALLACTEENDLTYDDDLTVEVARELARRVIGMDPDLQAMIGRWLLRHNHKDEATHLYRQMPLENRFKWQARALSMELLIQGLVHPDEIPAPVGSLLEGSEGEFYDGLSLDQVEHLLSMYCRDKAERNVVLGNCARARACAGDWAAAIAFINAIGTPGGRVYERTDLLAMLLETDQTALCHQQAEIAVLEFMKSDARYQGGILSQLYPVLRSADNDLQAMAQTLGKLNILIDRNFSIYWKPPQTLQQLFSVLDDETQTFDWANAQHRQEVAIECACRGYPRSVVLQPYQKDPPFAYWFSVRDIAIEVPKPYLDKWEQEETDPNVVSALVQARLHRVACGRYW